MICESKTYAKGSKCFLQCDPGFVSEDQVETTCIYDTKKDDFLWNIHEDRFKCKKAIGLIIGGILENYEYTNEVEVFAPELPCSSSPKAYPHKIVGTVSGFIKGNFGFFVM